MIEPLFPLKDIFARISEIVQVEFPEIADEMLPKDYVWQPGKSSSVYRYRDEGLVDFEDFYGATKQEAFVMANIWIIARLARTGGVQLNPDFTKSLSDRLRTYWQNKNETGQSQSLILSYMGLELRFPIFHLYLYSPAEVKQLNLELVPKDLQCLI